MRFFPDTRQTTDRSGNCPAGLVVDDHVVHPSLFDFYLLSHAGILGSEYLFHLGLPSIPDGGYYMFAAC